MDKATVEVIAGTVHVENLEVNRKDVADYLLSFEEDERDTALIHAVEVGVFCLERARSGLDTQFVRRQIDSLLTEVEKASREIPAATERAIVERIGTDDGQVLKPVHDIIELSIRTTNERIGDVRKLLEQEIDPARESSTLGRALSRIRDLLDPARADSIQGVLNASLQKLTAANGSLTMTVKEVVTDAIKPLREDVDRLGRDLGAQAAATAALQQTTEKGQVYEEEVVERLQRWAQGIGVEVEHVGGDRKPGDVRVVFPSGQLLAADTVLVVEVRDRGEPLGRKPISDALEAVMTERDAVAAVYVSRSREGLGKEIGEWGEGSLGRGPWVATTDEHLITALRYLVARRQLAALRERQPEVDAAVVADQLDRIRTALRRVSTINRLATETKNAVSEGIERVQSEADQLRNDIGSALDDIEESIRSAATKLPESA